MMIFLSLNISYNKYFIIFALLKDMLRMIKSLSQQHCIKNTNNGQEYYGDKTAPQTGTKNGDHGWADQACPVASQPIDSLGRGTCNLFTAYNKPYWKRGSNRFNRYLCPCSLCSATWRRSPAVSKRRYPRTHITGFKSQTSPTCIKERMSYEEVICICRFWLA